MNRHELTLLKEPTGIEGLDQVGQRLALDDIVRRQDIIADRQRPWDEHDAGLVKHRGQLRSEFSHVDDDFRRLGCGGPTAACA